jgi:pfkB family carbohydrate kinase
VIVVVGVPGWRTGDAPGPDGLASRVALAAAEAGSAVELVGRVGDDPTGDSLLLALTRAGVGHAAVLRDPARATPLVAVSIDGADEVAPDDDADPMAKPATADDPRLPILDAADLELGLRYVPDYHVLVVAHPIAGAALRTVDDAASYAGAHLVLLTKDPAVAGGLTTRAATVLDVPDDDDGAFAQVVAAYAVRLDLGAAPADAFREAVGQAGWSAADPD